MGRPGHTHGFLLLLPGELLDPCGHIDPESPVVRLGSNFTAVCVLQEKCMDYFHVNADYIFWKTNHETVPRTQYAVINRTASSVTFADVALLNTQLTCNIRTFGQIDQNVYGVRVVSGCECSVPPGGWDASYVFSVVCGSQASAFGTHLFLQTSLGAEPQFHDEYAENPKNEVVCCP